MDNNLTIHHQRESTFSDREAWALFRALAFIETVGWTLLITGIVFSHFKWPLHDWILPIGGSLHGVFVVSYMLIVVFAYRSMRWSTIKMLVAEAVSVVPYAALVFERYEANRRQKRHHLTLMMAVAAASSGSV